jgi:hypothetical protein
MKCTSKDLLERLKKKGTRSQEYTRGLIREKLNDDDEVATTSLKVSVSCPLGKMRMQVPCRPSTCSHLQCFDASLFLQMNERKPTWNCPVCDSKALYETLMIDGYFLDVLESPLLPKDENEIILENVSLQLNPFRNPYMFRYLKCVSFFRMDHGNRFRRKTTRRGLRPRFLHLRLAMVLPLLLQPKTGQRKTVVRPTSISHCTVSLNTKFQLTKITFL